jgi:DHA2 family methylenomycin A resistance protein-like MFS transporter
VVTRRDQAEAGTGRPGWTLAAAVAGFFMITLDALVASIAVPSIRDDLGGGITGLQWVLDGYTLMFATLLLSAGALADRIGARRAFAGGLVVFGVASAACGLAPSLVALVVARFVQGGSAAVLMPSSMSLIRQAFPDPARRARAVATWGMGGAVAASSGPLLGGLLTLASWRMIFFVNVPAGVAALALLSRTGVSPRRSVPFDALGQAAAVLAMGALTYGAIEAGTAGLSAPRVVGACGVSVAALAAFAVTQARGAHPMVPRGLLRTREVPVAVVVGFAFVVGYYGVPFIMSLYLQSLRGLSPLAAGAAFVPMMVSGASLTLASPRLTERAGARALVSWGMVVMAAGLVSLAVVGAAARPVPVWLLAVLMMPVGLAAPLVTPPVTMVLLTSVPADQAGTASGVYNTSRQAGGALAVAVFGALLAHRATFLAGLRASLLLAAGVAVVAAVTGLLLPRHRPAGELTDLVQELSAGTGAGSGAALLRHREACRRTDLVHERPLARRAQACEQGGDLVVRARVGQAPGQGEDHALFVQPTLAGRVAGQERRHLLVGRSWPSPWLLVRWVRPVAAH